ncbi:MOSC domain-containing protein [Bosea sp. LC85]|uniref:MOSC domain-containing protein n=1 Tax=Bosea sp. LC85 TaxID=1502851 RepID=UPI000AA3047D|nr:MOSC domain-containing protein [Bosea sp. LC85]
MTGPEMSGSVSALWRYPVSSMAGERLSVAPLDPSGVVGDRLWGIVDGSDERIASPGREKHFVEVPRGYARWTAQAGLFISADGTTWAKPDDAGAIENLSSLFGFPAKLKPFVRRGQVGFRPRYEHAPIHLLTTAAMRSLERDSPGSIVDERRFRPNIVVDWPDEQEPIPENGWLGREIRIGDVVLKGSIPCGRCGFITIAQAGLPLDVELLRTVVKRHSRNFGIYCDILVPGEIRPGDTVTLAGT